jgi:hypothetical protein
MTLFNEAIVGIPVIKESNSKNMSALETWFCICRGPGLWKAAVAKDQIDGYRSDEALKLSIALNYSRTVAHHLLGRIKEVEKERDAARYDVIREARHRQHIKEFLEELGPYLGLDEGTVLPEDFIEAAKRIRQGYADILEDNSSIARQISEKCSELDRAAQQYHALEDELHGKQKQAMQEYERADQFEKQCARLCIEIKELQDIQFNQAQAYSGQVARAESFADEVKKLKEALEDQTKQTKEMAERHRLSRECITDLNTMIEGLQRGKKALVSLISTCGKIITRAEQEVSERILYGEFDTHDMVAYPVRQSDGSTRYEFTKLRLRCTCGVNSSVSNSVHLSTCPMSITSRETAREYLRAKGCTCGSDENFGHSIDCPIRIEKGRDDPTSRTDLSNTELKPFPVKCLCGAGCIPGCPHADDCPMKGA